MPFDPEGVTLSGVSQTGKDKYHLASLICEGHFQANLFSRQGLYRSRPDDGLEIVLRPQIVLHFKIIFHLLNISLEQSIQRMCVASDGVETNMNVSVAKLEQ